MFIVMSRFSHNASVAQMDRVADFESVGRGFESLRARHFEQFTFGVWHPFDIHQKESEKSTLTKCFFLSGKFGNYSHDYNPRARRPPAPADSFIFKIGVI